MSRNYAFSRRVLDPETGDLDALIVAAARELDCERIPTTAERLAERLGIPLYMVRNRPITAQLSPTTRARIYHALVTLANQHGRPPSVREIAAAAGISSTGRMSYHLDLLVALGLLRHLGGARGYVPVRREARHE